MKQSASEEELRAAKAMRAEWAANDAARDKDVQKPEGVSEYCNIVYAEREEYNSLNLYKPQDAAGRIPVVIAIHGGGYFYGSKELYSFYCMDVAKRGFAVVDYDYRLAPEYRFPSPIEDAFLVMNWVVENADTYALDTKNVFLIGDSAGAQLSSQVAAIWANPSYAKCFGITVPDVTIRGLSLACGMYDLYRTANAAERHIFDQYAGPDFTDREDIRLKVLDHIDANYPPSFVFSAANDFLRDCCEPMGDFLRSRGVPAVTKIYGTPEQKHIAHVFHVDFRYPEGELARAEQAEFMRKLVK